MRSNGKRAGEWSHAEYARRKRVAKATGINSGYLASAPPQKKDGRSAPAKTALTGKVKNS